jgi:hypothetical protein
MMPAQGHILSARGKRLNPDNSMHARGKLCLLQIPGSYGRLPDDNFGRATGS